MSDCAASLLPMSRSSSAKKASPARMRPNVDLPTPCGPSSTGMQSTWQPGSKVRATAEMSQRAPTLRV